MIQVEGQYYLRFSMEAREDLFSEAEFNTFNLIEEAGNLLPTFELVVTLSDETILGLLSESNSIEVSYGLNPTEAWTAFLTIARVDTLPVGKDQRRVVITGLRDNLEYVNRTSSRIFRGNASSVLEKVLAKHFHVDMDLETDDNQSWIQLGTSNRSFVHQLWLHSFIEGSVPVLGITADGWAIVRDLRKLASKSPTWKFTPNAESGDNDITYSGDPLIELHQGIMNSWYGNPRTNLQVDTTTGILSMDTPDPALLLNNGQRDYLPIPRFNNTRAVSDNVHPRYWSAYNSNLSRLAMASSVKVKVKFDRGFREVTILDTVAFSGEGSDDPQAAQALSGNHLVTKVVRTISSKSLVTSVDMVREQITDL